MSDQMEFPFPFDRTKFRAFLTRWVAIEDEEDRLREEKRVLKKDYDATFPMRGVLTAIKIVRAEAKLEQHPTEGMPRVHLALLQHEVEMELSGLRKALDSLLADGMMSGAPIPDMAMSDASNGEDRAGTRGDA